MIFSHVYLNAVGDVRMVYDVHGGQRERAFPRDVSGVTEVTWDSEELSLTVVDSNNDTREFTLTSEEIEQTKESEPL